MGINSKVGVIDGVAFVIPVEVGVETKVGIAVRVGCKVAVGTTVERKIGDGFAVVVGDTVAGAAHDESATQNRITT